MSDPRAGIFAEVRKIAPKGVFDDPGAVNALDNILDALSFPRAPKPRHINQAGVELIKHFEGCELTAYLDPVGIPTIGYGSTGSHVKLGMKITEAEAEALLRDDLARFEACVEAAAPGLPDNKFAACCSLAFNIGCDAFKGSSVCRLARTGDHGGAMRAFALWNRAGGRVLPGLVKRRAAEAELYGS